MSSSPTITVCVCTRNRPGELARCLQSLQLSAHAIAQTVVSDDSTDRLTTELIERSYPWVRYVQGPRRGLGANRNCALAVAEGEYVLFLDDDACLGPHFVDRCLAMLAQYGSAGQRIIVSGRENNRGVLVRAHDQSFLGFQRVPYQPNDPLKTIVINATLFPRALFASVSFDEQLIYGYDEVDIALKAVHRGYRIVQCDEAINDHYPSAVNRSYYRPHAEASRLYVTLNRYARFEDNPLKAVVYVLCASMHCGVAALRRAGPGGVVDARRTIKTAFTYWSKAQGEASREPDLERGDKSP
jgi:GT2 family glycosyltransferase